MQKRQRQLRFRDLRPSKNCLCPKLFVLLRRGGIHIDEENNPKGPKSICEKANDLLEIIADWQKALDQNVNMEELEAAVQMLRQACEEVIRVLSPYFSTANPFLAVLVQKNEAENELTKLGLAIHDVLSRLGFKTKDE